MKETETELLVSLLRTRKSTLKRYLAKKLLYDNIFYNYDDPGFQEIRMLSGKQMMSENRSRTSLYVLYSIIAAYLLYQ